MPSTAYRLSWDEKNSDKFHCGNLPQLRTQDDFSGLAAAVCDLRHTRPPDRRPERSETIAGVETEQPVAGGRSFVIGAVRITDADGADVFLVEEIFDPQELAELPFFDVLAEAGTPGGDGVAARVAVVRIKRNVALAEGAAFDRGRETAGLMPPCQLAVQGLLVDAGDV